MKKLNFTLVSILVSVSLLFSGCASFNSTSTSGYEPTIKATASFATGEALTSIKDATKRKEVAQYVYSISSAARTLGGQVPNVAEVQATLKSFLGDEYNDQLANLVVTLSNLYQDYLDKEIAVVANNDKVKAAGIVLEAIAEGAEQAASSYK